MKVIVETELEGMDFLDGLIIDSVGLANTDTTLFEEINSFGGSIYERDKG